MDMVSSFGASTNLSLQNLGSMTLQNGDNDAQRRWGGSVRPAMTGNPVRELQDALIALGTLTVQANGLFGPHTQEALRRFQWYLTNIPNRLHLQPGSQPASGTIFSYPPAAAGIPGICNATIAAQILSWRMGNFVTTTPLVRLNIKPISNVELGVNFHPLNYPGAQSDEILVHADFAAGVSGILNGEAEKLFVLLDINQAFRRQNVPPSGAVVTPATRSLHLIGHAVDLNILDDDKMNTSQMFLSGTQTANATKFVAAAKAGGLRWGGDFHNPGPDPVHFDDHSMSSMDYDMNFFFAQYYFVKQHPMRLVS
jgi:peptidoglycan hydrolase-like protein with peptidoglycan-binding domain